MLRCKCEWQVYTGVLVGAGWLEERLETLYKPDPGYSDKASSLFTLDLQSPQELPDNLRGEQWNFVQLPLSDLMSELQQVKQVRLTAFYYPQYCARCKLTTTAACSLLCQQTWHLYTVRKACSLPLTQAAFSCIGNRCRKGNCCCCSRVSCSTQSMVLAALLNGHWT